MIRSSSPPLQYDARPARGLGSPVGANSRSTAVSDIQNGFRNLPFYTPFEGEEIGDIGNVMPMVSPPSSIAPLVPDLMPAQNPFDALGYPQYPVTPTDNAFPLSEHSTPATIYSDIQSASPGNTSQSRPKRDSYGRTPTSPTPYPTTPTHLPGGSAVNPMSYTPRTPDEKRRTTSNMTITGPTHKVRSSLGRAKPGLDQSDTQPTIPKYLPTPTLSNEEITTRRKKFEQKLVPLDLPTERLKALQSLFTKTLQGEFESGITAFAEFYEAEVKSAREQEGRSNSDVASLKKRNESAENRVKDLTSTVDKLLVETDKLKSEVTRRKKRSDELKDKVEAQKKDIIRMQGEKSKADETYYDLQGSANADMDVLRGKLEASEAAERDLKESIRLSEEKHRKAIQVAEAALQDQLKQATSDQSVTADTIRDLKLDKATALQKVQKLEENLISESQEKSKHEARIRELFDEVRSENDSKNLLLAKLEELKTANSNADTANNAHTIALQAEIEELKSQQKYVQDLLSKKTETSDAISAQNTELQKELVDLRAKNEELHQEVKTISGSLEGVTKDLKNKSEELVNERNAALTSENSSRSAFETELRESRRKIETISSSLEKATRDFNRATEQLADERNKLYKSQESEQASKTAYEEAQQEIETLSNSLERITGSLGVATTELAEERKKSSESAKASKSAYETELLESRRKIETLSSDLDKVRKDLEEAAKELVNERYKSSESAKASISAHNAELLESQRKAGGLSNTLEELRRDLSKAAKDLTDERNRSLESERLLKVTYDADLLKSQQKVNALSDDLEDLRRRLDKKDGELDDERKLLQAERVSKSTCEAELLGCRQRIETLSNSLEGLRKDLNTRTDELNAERVSLQSEKKSKSVCEADLLESQRKAERLSSDIKTLAKDLEKRNEELAYERKSLLSEKASKSTCEAELLESRRLYEGLVLQNKALEVAKSSTSEAQQELQNLVEAGVRERAELEARLHLKIRNLESELLQIQGTLSSRAESDTEVINKLRQEKATLEQERALLERTIKGLQEEKSMAEKQKNTLEQEKTSLQREKDSLENEYNSMKQERSSLDQGRSGLEYEKNNLIQENTRLKQERDGLEQEKSALKREQSSLEREKDTLQQEKNGLEREKSNLVQERNSLEQNKNRLEKENNTLEKEKKDLREAAATAEKDWSSLIQQFQEEMNVSKQELDSKVRSLQDQLAAERAGHATARPPDTDLSAEATAVLNKEIRKLQKEVTVRIESEKSLESQIKALRLELKQKANIEDTLETQFKEAQAANRVEKKELKSQLKNQEVELERLATDIGKLQSHNNRLQETIQQRRATETSAAQIQIDKLVSEVETLRERTATLQSQLDVSTSERDEHSAVAQRREGQINLLQQEIQKMSDGANKSAQAQRETYAYIDKLKSDFTSQEEAAQKARQEVAILAGKIDYKDRSIAALQSLIESSTDEINGMELLRQQINEKSYEIERLQESLHGQEEQVRKAQVAAFKNLETAKHAFLEDNEIEQKLKHEVFANLEKWVREYVPRRKASDDKPSASLIAELALLSNPDSLVALSQKHPQIIVQGLLSHFAVENLLKQPFRLLPTQNEAPRSEDSISGVLQKLYDSFLQFDAPQGHDWRFKTFQLLSQLDSQPSSTRYHQDTNLRRSRADYCELLAQRFITGPAGSLLGPCRSEPERLEKLVKAFDGIAEVSLKLWSQKAFLSVRGFSDVKDTPFSWDSSHVQAHALHHLSRPGKTHSRDGDPIYMVIQPEIVAYGNEDGSEYDKEKVWARAVVALSV
ncbi:hypothetical protein TWF281_010493 [Arthrobotrys megalospora]